MISGYQFGIVFAAAMPPGSQYDVTPSAAGLWEVNIQRLFCAL